jgi:hypothetical protein
MFHYHQTCVTSDHMLIFKVLNRQNLYVLMALLTIPRKKI